MAGPSDELARKADFRALHLPHSQVGPGGTLPRLQRHARDGSGGKPDYYDALHVSGDPTQEYADYQVRVVRDVRRSLDYLGSRSDVDGRRLAYQGCSWGGFVAPVVLAVEPRFAAAIIRAGGLDSRARPRPEVDAINYAPRVRLPVLMLNGRYDLEIPLESSARPMFQLLGTPPDGKATARLRQRPLRPAKRVSSASRWRGSTGISDRLSRQRRRLRIDRRRISEKPTATAVLALSSSLCTSTVCSGATFRGVLAWLVRPSSRCVEQVPASGTETERRQQPR